MSDEEQTPGQLDVWQCIEEVERSAVQKRLDRVVHPAQSLVVKMLGERGPSTLPELYEHAQGTRRGSFSLAALRTALRELARLGVVVDTGLGRRAEGRRAVATVWELA